jgi:hypothetical protein
MLPLWLGRKRLQDACRSQKTLLEKAQAGAGHANLALKCRHPGSHACGTTGLVRFPIKQQRVERRTGTQAQRIRPGCCRNPAISAFGTSRRPKCIAAPPSRRPPAEAGHVTMSYDSARQRLIPGVRKIFFARPKDSPPPTHMSRGKPLSHCAICIFGESNGAMQPGVGWEGTPARLTASGSPSANADQWADTRAKD